MRMAVTGGSGVVGRAVVSRLVIEGHHVDALARSADSADTLRGLGANPVHGDLMDTGSLAELCQSAEWVFHIGGINETCSSDPDLMDRTNVQGTANLLQAAARSGVDRVVHTSSVATIGQEKGQVATEHTSHRGSYLSRYERSKALAEELARDFTDVDVVIVNPSSVQGPGRATGSGKMILDLVRGKLPVLVDADVSLVDVDDCARGHVLAASHGVSGGRYILSGATISTRAAVELLARMMPGFRKPLFLPGSVIAVVAAVGATMAGLLGKSVPFCSEMIRVMRHGSICDGSKATRDLGLEYTPIEATLGSTIEWFRSEGLL